MRISKVRYRVSVRSGDRARMDAVTFYLFDQGASRYALYAFPLLLGLALCFAFYRRPEPPPEITVFTPAPATAPASISVKAVNSTPEETSAAESVSDEEPAAAQGLLSQLGMKVFQDWKGDLNGMAKRRVIRALVVYSKTMYFLDGARERGITYDALKEFEKFINAKYRTGNMRIFVVPIPVSRDELLKGLIEGRGDIAAANLTITPERKESVDFSNPVYDGVSQWVVTGPSSPSISSLDDLQGRSVFVRKSSSYYESLQKLNDSFRAAGKPPVNIVPVSEYLESEDILEMVDAGLYPVTVVDSHIGALWAQVFKNIHVHKTMPLREGERIGWAFRQGSPQLRAAVNSFVGTHRTGTAFGNSLLRKYLVSADWIHNNAATAERKKFDATVKIFRRYAGMYGFDYLLVAAQGYQESRLDQNAVSRSGAIGIMQLLPATARGPVGQHP